MRGRAWFSLVWNVEIVLICSAQAEYHCLKNWIVCNMCLCCQHQSNVFVGKIQEGAIDAYIFST